MLIGSDSPLRLLPENLDRKQMLFFDGIRVAVETAERAHERLVEALYRATTTDISPADQSRLVSLCFLDAWSIVDSTNRLLVLLNRLPRFKKRASSLQLFRRRTKSIKGLRDMVQHLDTEIDNLVANNLSVFGTLTWLVLVNAQAGEFKAGSLVSGSQFGAMHALPSLDGIVMRAYIDHITLTAGGHEVNLSAILIATTEFIAKFERELARLFSYPQFVGHAPVPSDFLVVADMTVCSGHNVPDSNEPTA